MAWRNWARFVLWFVFFATCALWWVAAILGIVHWSYNFQYTDDFLTLSEIKKTYWVVVIFYFASSLSMGMIVERWHRRRGTSAAERVLLASFFILLIAATIWAFPSSPPCSETVHQMKDAGVAYDARERGLLGGIKIDEPSGDRFSPDAKQMAWWGTFARPFEYWGNPDLTADWFDPEGQKVESIKVDAERCKLAVARVKQERFQPGIWRVDVSCKDGTVIDRQQFAVGNPPVISSDVQVVGGLSSEETQQITVK